MAGVHNSEVLPPANGASFFNVFHLILKGDSNG